MKIANRYEVLAEHDDVSANEDQAIDGEHTVAQLESPDLHSDQPSHEDAAPRPLSHLERFRHALGINCSNVDAEQLPVLICLDFEGDTSMRRLKGEKATIDVGIATLDPLEASKVNGGPGDRGMNWHAAIKYHHLCVSEHAHLNNRKFCNGDVLGFRFGNSKFFPFRRLDQHADSQVYFDQRIVSIIGDATHEFTRGFHLVGHAIKNDIEFMRSHGVDLAGKGLQSVFDTQLLMRNLDPYVGPKLSTLLQHFGIAHEPSMLHNGGNDAALTLHLALAMATLTVEQLRQCVYEDTMLEVLGPTFGPKLKQRLWPPDQHVADDEELYWTAKERSDKVGRRKAQKGRGGTKN